MSLRERYKKGDMVWIRTPPNLRKESVEKGITIGKLYQGRVEDVLERNLGIIIVDDFSRSRYTSLRAPALLLLQSDWILVDPFLENLKQVLE